MNSAMDRWILGIRHLGVVDFGAGVQYPSRFVFDLSATPGHYNWGVWAGLRSRRNCEDS